jgi:GNAT superfamily N-acetyltransferase
MKQPTFIVRPMTRAELDLPAEWAAQEGWNPGLHDTDCFYATDPNGFFLGVLDGEPVGCISTVAYDNAFGFLGFYIVRPEYRGQGYGLQIWNAGMSYLGDRNVGLDGVLAQQQNYQKSGFRLAYRNVRNQGVGGGSVPAGVVDLAKVSFAELLAYDRALFPAPRAKFLECWIRRPQGAALAIRSEGRLAGYGVIRVCRQGYKIGPLFADSEAIAENLFQALAAQAPGASIFLDIPEVNPAAVALAQRHDMQPVFETARMYTKGAPNLPLARIYGVTTFELG